MIASITLLRASEDVVGIAIEHVGSARRMAVALHVGVLSALLQNNGGRQGFKLITADNPGIEEPIADDDTLSSEALAKISRKNPWRC